jgi:hypothetical protein
MNLEGDEPPVKYSTLLERPDLRHIGSNTRYAYTMIYRPPVAPTDREAARIPIFS